MDSRARAGPHGAPCWRLMVGAYARDARAYFAAPWASWTRALRSALPHPLDRPLRPQTGETAPFSVPLLLLPAGRRGRQHHALEGAQGAWMGRTGAAVHLRLGTLAGDGPVLLGRVLRALPHPAAAPPHSPPPHPTPQSQGADGRHQAQAHPAHGGGSVPGDPGATSVALVAWLNRMRHFIPPVTDFRMNAFVGALRLWIGVVYLSLTTSSTAPTAAYS